MTTVNLSPVFNAVTNFDQFGQIVSGGYLYTYQAGTSTPLPTYTDVNGTIYNTNPIQLGTDGKLPQEMWLIAAYAYKFVLTDSTGQVIDTYDNISGIITINELPTPSSLPSGTIIMWSGAITEIPSGFVLCDGTYPGAPDLRDKFVVGAGDLYNVGDTGGSANAVVVSHSHSANSNVIDPGHDHVLGGTAAVGNSAYQDVSPAQIDLNSPIGNTASNVTGISVSTSISTTGQDGTNQNLPPYYALCYIFKT